MPVSSPGTAAGRRLRRPAFRRRGRRGEMRRLARQRRRRLRRDLGAVGAAGRGHRRDDEPLDERGRAQEHPGALLVVEQLDGQLGREQRAAEVHQHDDAPALVGGRDRLRDPARVGPEGVRVQARRDLHGHAAAVQHLARQRDRGVGERPAVGDHDDPDPPVRVAGCPRAHRARQDPPMAVAAAAMSSVDEVAPGSWCPALRSPR